MAPPLPSYTASSFLNDDSSMNNTNTSFDTFSECVILSAKALISVIDTYLSEARPSPMVRRHLSDIASGCRLAECLLKPQGPLENVEGLSPTYDSLCHQQAKCPPTCGPVIALGSPLVSNRSHEEETVSIAPAEQPLSSLNRYHGLTTSLTEEPTLHSELPAPSSNQHWLGANGPVMLSEIKDPISWTSRLLNPQCGPQHKAPEPFHQSGDVDAELSKYVNSAGYQPGDYEVCHSPLHALATPPVTETCCLRDVVAGRVLESRSPRECTEGVSSWEQDAEDCVLDDCEAAEGSSRESSAQEDLQFPTPRNGIESKRKRSSEDIPPTSKRPKVPFTVTRIKAEANERSYVLDRTNQGWVDELTGSTPEHHWRDSRELSEVEVRNESDPFGKCIRLYFEPGKWSYKWRGQLPDGRMVGVPLKLLNQVVRSPSASIVHGTALAQEHRQ